MFARLPPREFLVYPGFVGAYRVFFVTGNFRARGLYIFYECLDLSRAGFVCVLYSRVIFSDKSGVEAGVIKARTGSIYKYIDEITKENGGEPPTLIGLEIPFTNENWECIMAITQFEFDEDFPEGYPEILWN